MKQFLITVGGVLVGLILFLVIAPIVLISMIGASASSSKPTNPANMVLSLDLREGFSDQRNANAFSFGDELNTITLVRRLEAAGKDAKVKGLFIRANTLGMAPAQSEEIRAAIAKFRADGKYVITHVQSDALEASLSGYMATAGSDELWLQETGELMPMGLAAENAFLGGFFEKYKMQPQFEQRDEYKNAVNEYTQKGYTPAHREATEGLLKSLYDTMIASIAADRRLTPEAARAAIEGTPYTGAAAVTAKLIDKLGRPEDAEKAAIDRAGKDAELVELMDYEPAKPTGPTIALVGGEGPIVTGPIESNPFADESLMNSDTLAASLLEAAEDKDVKAIIFRVSSPGGSPVASDQILHAVQTARKTKPVVVSMGEYAASGGYYVSAGANAIVASPTTLTGSIGIYGGKIVFGDALETYLGVTTDEVKIGSPLVNMFTFSDGFTNSQRQAFASMIDRGYLDFKTKVAQGRGMTVEKVGEVAKGRVWTGAQAKELGLVDELGGLSVAIEKAKSLAKIDAASPVGLKIYPAEKSPVEQIQELFGVSGEAAAGAAALGAVLGDERVNALLARALRERHAALRAESGAPSVR